MFLLTACAPDGDAPSERRLRESPGEDTAGTDSDDPDSDVPESTNPDSGLADTSLAPITPRLAPVDCGSVSFGDASVERAIWIDAAANPSGDGSEASPFQSLAEGLAQAGEIDAAWIESGTYPGNLEIVASGITLYGRGPHSTVLSASPGSPNLVIAAGDSGSIGLCQLAATGGSFGVVVESGGVSIEAAELRGATRAGLVVNGVGRWAWLDGSSITGTVAEADVGSGISVGDGASLELSGTTVADNDGIGILASGTGTVLDVRDSTVDRNGGGVATAFAGGIVIVNAVVATLERVTLSQNVFSGIDVSGEGPEVHASDLVVAGTRAHQELAAGLRFHSGDVTVSNSQVRGGDGFGLVAFTGAYDLLDVHVTGVARRRDGAGGIGACLEVNSATTIERLVATENEVAGLAAWEGVTCTDCLLADNGVVGAYVGFGQLVLDATTVRDNGAAGIAAVPERWAQVELNDALVGPHPYAGIWLSGQRSWLYVDNSVLQGGAGFVAEGSQHDGFAVWGWHAPTTLEDSVVEGAEQVGVYLGESGLKLSGNAWNNSGLDLVMTKSTDAEKTRGLDEVPESDINSDNPPTYTALTLDDYELECR